jgi:hypothetical protein
VIQVLDDIRVGHKRTWRLQFAISALHSIADIQCDSRNVCFGPDPGHRKSRARANRSGRQSSASQGSMLLIDIGEPARTTFLAGNTKRVFKLN